MSIKKRIQLTENGIAQDVDILTSAECVTFEDGDTLQAKLDNGDLASSDVLGDVDGLDGNVVDSLNELNDSAKETSELVSELANRGGVTSALRKEVGSGWSSVSKLPYGFNCGCSVVLHNEIHIIGGYNNYKVHYKYNGSSWSSVSTLLYNFYNGSVVVYNDELHILGTNTTSYRTKHYKWNGTTWESVSTLPYQFYNGSVVTYNDEIHLFGGKGGQLAHYKYNGSSWEAVGNLPYYFYNGGAVVLNNEIHLIGGGTYNNVIYGTYHYKYNGTSWSSVSTSPYDFKRGGVVIYNNEIHILGGSGYDTNHYKFNGTVWRSVSTLPYKFYGGDCVVNDKCIHILGGEYDSIIENSHYSIKLGTYLNGYSKADTDIYLPISTTPITSNLTATEDGYTVTEDGYVEILLNE